YASPKAREFFRRIKKSLQAKPPPPTTPIRYVRIYDPRPGAAWRSLLLPGWGHLYRGEKRFGYGVLGTTVVLASATVVFFVKGKSARDRYLAAKDPAEIARTYDTYNRYYHLRHASLYALGALWLAAYLDASFRPVKRIRATISSPAAGFGFGFTVSFR
ncbi:MAG: hypothetical protein GXO73_06345, partial [Calditrichaeota bacterium]|nr:hypothetical protein [Calditrichota bacterium]